MCACGVPVESHKVEHLTLTNHECVYHNPSRCRVCITIRQIEDYLARFPGSKTGEAA